MQITKRTRLLLHMDYTMESFAITCFEKYPQVLIKWYLLLQVTFLLQVLYQYVIEHYIVLLQSCLVEETHQK